MNNFQIIKDFHELLNDIGFTIIERNNEYILIYQDDNDEGYQNCAIVHTVLSEKLIDALEIKFTSLHRTPVIYFENTEELEMNKKILRARGYTFAWEDSWLFYENNITDIAQFNDCRTVTTDEEFEVFLSTYDACYQKDDPQNPYGDVKNHLQNTRKGWDTYGKTDRMKHFIAYDDGTPVAISKLTMLNNLGYIAPVGSLPSVRGKGFGKKISLLAVYVSQQMGNTNTFLLTEAGTYPYEFYKRIGFVEKFTAIGMKKER